jgi:phosphoglycolate phosphatase-like HAD superfamily hydrolase
VFEDFCNFLYYFNKSKVHWREKEPFMSQDTHQRLKDFKAAKDFFIGVDSDGCAFDNMEIKHQKCFCPQAIKFFNLQPISQYVREAWDFVNLYSKTRGCNRFLGLIYTIDLLRERKEVSASRVNLPDLTLLFEWTKQETKLGNAALKNYARLVNDPIIQTALAWSLAVNDCISAIEHNIPPFPYVKEALSQMSEKADVMVVSSAPLESLVREWSTNGIDKYVRLLAGQEYGSKSEQVGFTASGKYKQTNILLIGDAPGDLAAALKNNALFYPILPGKEAASWERFYRQALAKFFNTTYAGEYQEMLLKEFEAFLPETPPWKK